MKIKNTIIVLIIFITNTVFAQNQRIVDSLKTRINNSKHDTSLINSQIKLAYEFKHYNLDTALLYSDSALKKSLQIHYRKGIADAYRLKGTIAVFLNDYPLADSLLNISLERCIEIDDREGIMESYNNFAIMAFFIGENQQALKYYSKAYEIAEKNNFIKQKALYFNNISMVNTNMGYYEKAVENSLRAIKIFNEIKSPRDIARCNLNIACTYIELKEYKKALNYMNTAFDIFIKLNETRGQSICLTNIAEIYYKQKKYDKALQNYDKAVELDKENKDLNGISANYNSIGTVYFLLGQYKTAMEYYEKSLKICEQIGDKNCIANLYYKISQIETKHKKFLIAEKHCINSINIFNEVNELNKKRISIEQLAVIYRSAGKYKEAYDTYMKASELKDSLFNIEKTQKIAQIEEKFENEKLEKENLTLLYENNLKQSEISQQQKILNIYLFAFIFAVISVIIVLIQYKKKNNAYKYLVKKNLDLLDKEEEVKKIKGQIQTSLSDIDPKISVSDDDKEKIIKKLEKLFDNKKIFIKHDLTLEKLAKRLSTNRVYLSQIINDKYGKKYTEFLTEYRIKEAMSGLSDRNKNRIFSIETIAKESGFKSVSSFNPVFKKYTGVTPSVFIQTVNNKINI